MKAYGVVVSLYLALTVIGCGNDSDSHVDGNGFCENPAPIEGEFDESAPGYIVVFKESVEAAEEVNRLIEIYEIEVSVVYEYALNGFFGTMSDITVELIRCENSVEYVNYNGTAQLIE